MVIGYIMNTVLTYAIGFNFISIVSPLPIILWFTLDGKKQSSYTILDAIDGGDSLLLTSA